jgi:hypothetical protein
MLAAFLWCKTKSWERERYAKIIVFRSAISNECAIPVTLGRETSMHRIQIFVFDQHSIMQKIILKCQIVYVTQCRQCNINVFV